MVVLGLLGGTWELIDAIPLVPLLAFVAYRLAQRIGRIDDDPEVALILFAAFWAKMLGALIRGRGGGVVLRRHLRRHRVPPVREGARADVPDSSTSPRPVRGAGPTS